jgi:signal peptidase II
LLLPQVGAARPPARPRGPFRPKVVVEGLFDLRYAENPGVAFSMLQDIPGGRIVLTLLAVAAFLLVLYYLHKTPVENTRLHVALGLVGGGAIGNLMDRVIYGKVTDFIGWKYHGHEWPAYNIADAALCIGVGLMLLDMVIGWRAQKKAQAGAPTAGG